MPIAESSEKSVLFIDALVSPFYCKHKGDTSQMNDSMVCISFKKLALNLRDKTLVMHLQNIEQGENSNR